MKSKRESIDKFMSSKKIAIAGVSRNEHKTGSAFFRELDKKGINVVGITPHIDSFDGKPCYKSVEDLPSDIEGIITAVKPEVTLEVVKSAYNKGINNIWMQLGSQCQEAINFAEEKGMNVIYKECALMYFEPVDSIHKFHRTIKKLFGGYHK
jgi:uncharacterized protein